ncbi:hypothetical protein [Marinoscillum sp. 108]|uniref:hypothetical protein n=1 Tax=Marinoscillum sp. 108 TaxID=2653151 RepID=UPI0012F3E513|nr:hypothetical protein [Marinoscillum sp. 108]VXD16331.1 conserved hypothetical protein [Marinoscillum sp. 108]
MPPASHVYIHEDISSIQELYSDLTEDLSATPLVIDFLTASAEKLLHAHRTNLHAAFVEIRNGLPQFAGKSISEIFNYAFTMLDARTTVARLHGFEDWEEVERHSENSFNLEFEKAIDLLLGGEVEHLSQLLSTHPALIKARSPFGHQATLLIYCGSNGVEMRRQVVPDNLPEMVNLLLAEGAEKHAKARVYGGQFTTYQLAESSAHPHDAGIMDKLLRVLK